MQKKRKHKPTRSRFTLLRQLCNLIPNHLVPGLARQYDAEAKSRTFKPWSHVVSLIYAQLTHALGVERRVRRTAPERGTAVSGSGSNPAQQERSVARQP